jgi:hypothetical protein
MFGMVYEFSVTELLILALLGLLAAGVVGAVLFLVLRAKRGGGRDDSGEE